MIGCVSFKGHFELTTKSSQTKKKNLILDSATLVYQSTKIIPGLVRLFYGDGVAPTEASDSVLASPIGSVVRSLVPNISNPSPDYTRIRFRFTINPEEPLIINEIAIGTATGDLFAKTTLETPFFIDTLELAEIDYVLDLYHGINNTPIPFPIQNDSPVFMTSFLRSTLDVVTPSIEFFNPNENLDVVVFSTDDTSFPVVNSVVYPNNVSVRSPLNRVVLSLGMEMLKCTIPTTNNFLSRSFNALGITVRGRNNLTMVLKLDRTVSVPFRGELDLVFKRESGTLAIV